MGGGKREHSKNRRGINVEKVKKEEGMVVEKRKPPNRKVYWNQWGLGPRLRVLRHVVGAKARFQAQRTILSYTHSSI